MPFIVINLSNAYDVENNSRSAPQEGADTRARAILSQFPTAQVLTDQVLKDYSAKVSIIAKAPAEPAPEPEASAG
ncbi:MULTISPECIES: hypothetical protein [Pseudomonas]|jgi:hypothetical protein|uniref:Uncharacterized protein n=1 Tax=Pseudomonas putida (strain ATCC 47054 / DSM 6125 / CFBP 8728 / NCIMB 11950 / KT2440) TaxID=160488 RepID=Q88G70_PSEPK|nr:MULTISPECIES: hypothetical protein [Pseudomonas]AAN69449.1 conserved protein of unknown function [Pseudomonas putida KT2440]KMU94295.1 prophage PssSM-02 [Pseudomonas putida]KMY31094.1 prophage PssSM-02 [Pseudomonas putida]MDD2082619.1 hypothetical protein [Pseudomonas putida]PXZ45887.1 hypothetical protein DM483_26895 [Pseudomonas sp. SMT-1]